MQPRPQDTQATFCATLVDEWSRCGLQHAVISPGSRSTPLALALVADGRFSIHVHHDERSAGFLAIGLAQATEEPTVVLTTSGTAAVELHPAVVEADLAGVPLLVCTADRPPELIDVGAPQAIDQTRLFGVAARWFHAPGVADESARERWRPLAARAYAEATGHRRGPVHLNLAFREPLVGEPGPLPVGRAQAGASWTWRPRAQGYDDAVITAADALVGRRGVLIAGAGSGDGPAVAALGAELGWPVLASPQAPVWGEPGATIPAVDSLLRVPEIGTELNPEIIVHLGAPMASRVVGEWAAATDAVDLVVADQGRWLDPQATAAVVLSVEPAAQVAAWMAELDHLPGAGANRPQGWRARWEELGDAAARAIADSLAGSSAVAEPAVAQMLVDALGPDANLIVSSSMPIRDLEWYVTAHGPLRVWANRGANGIDGVVSTALGVAIGSGAPSALLIGDVAFLHDSNGLLGANQREADLVIVVVNNDGGGIFSFLPQADVVDHSVFEQLYGTPHGLDLVALAQAFGVEAVATTDVGAAVSRALAAGGVHVVVVNTDRDANREVHARLNGAVADAVTAVDPAVESKSVEL